MSTPAPIVISTTYDPVAVNVTTSEAGPTIQIEVSNAPGPVGPTNTLIIGTVSTLPAGGTATASITGTAPAQTLNLGIPKGDPGTVQDLASPNGTVAVAGSAGHPTVDVVYGTVANTAAQGNDTRIVNALQPSSAAGGDSSGTLGNLSNNKIKGVSVTNTPTAGNALVATGTAAAAWGPLTAVSGRWGDGSDGNVTISTNTSLTQDMFYDNLTINSGKVLNTNGWRVHVRNTLTVNSTGVIGATGNAAPGGGSSTAGAAGSTNTLAGGKAGGSGAGGAGTTGTLAGGAGGASGTGSAGGTSTSQIAATFNNPRNPVSAFDFLFFNATGFAWPTGAAGGGGAVTPGGGGGAGGGVALINARIIVNNGSINSDGGAGGTPTGTNASGGGGGGGGTIFVNTTVISGSGTVTANGGAGGVKTGTGTNGTAGSAGYAQLIVWTV